MELLVDKVRQLWQTYEYYLDHSDKRVDNWFLMGSYCPTLCLTAAYLVIVWYGPRLMENRKPIRLAWMLFLYNTGLVALNFHIFYELLTASWRLGYSYSCQPVSYSDDPDEMRIARALWWYYFSKLIEFMDTFFFILRKKNNQISFLHVYHHASMFPIWWTGIKWAAGGQSFFGAMINSFIHVLMYTYYGASALGPQIQKYLWWKKYLTSLQLVQFVVVVSHAVQSLVLQCPYPMWMQWSLVAYGVSILLLFLNFYFQAYIKPTVSKSKKTNGQVSNGNGHKMYDHATNGFVSLKRD